MKHAPAAWRWRGAARRWRAGRTAPRIALTARRACGKRLQGTQHRCVSIRFDKPERPSTRLRPPHRGRPGSRSRYRRCAAQRRCSRCVRQRGTTLTACQHHAAPIAARKAATHSVRGLGAKRWRPSAEIFACAAVQGVVMQSPCQASTAASARAIPLKLRSALRFGGAHLQSQRRHGAVLRRSGVQRKAGLQCSAAAHPRACAASGCLVRHGATHTPSRSVSRSRCVVRKARALLVVARPRCARLLTWQRASTCAPTTAAMARWRALLLCVALVACAGVRTAVAEEAAADAAADAGPPPEFAKLRVKELQAILAARGEECKGCSEKADLVARAAEVWHLPIKARLFWPAPRRCGCVVRSVAWLLSREPRSRLRRGAAAASCADLGVGVGLPRACRPRPRRRRRRRRPPTKKT